MKKILFLCSTALLITLVSCTQESDTDTIVIDYHFTAPIQEFDRYAIVHGNRKFLNESGEHVQEDYLAFVERYEFPNLSILKEGQLPRSPDPVKLGIEKTDHPEIWIASYLPLGDKKQLLSTPRIGQVASSKLIVDSWVPELDLEQFYEIEVIYFEKDESKRIYGYSAKEIQKLKWVIIENDAHYPLMEAIEL